MFNVKAGRGYAVQGYIKILQNNPPQLWQTVKLQMQFIFPDNATNPNYVLEAQLDHQGNHVTSKVDISVFFAHNIVSFSSYDSVLSP